MLDSSNSTTVPIVDNPSAQDLFATRAAGLFVSTGNVHITLVARRCDHRTDPGPYSDLVIGRLVMPLATAAELGHLLSEFTAKLKATTAEHQGVVQPARVLQ